MQILNDVLDMSKIESGAIELFMEALNLRECIEASIDTFYSLAKSKGIEVGYVFPGNMPDVIISDSTRLGQILRNLLGNALKVCLLC